MKKILLVFFIIIILIATSIFITLKYQNSKATREIKPWQKTQFDLREVIPYGTEYMVQSTWRSCWAYATLDSIETNIMLHNGKQYDFSEAHTEYLTSTELAGSRRKDDGGSWVRLLEYIAQKKGPVLQQDYPNKIYNPEEYEYLKQAKPIITSVTTNQFQRNRRKK